VPAKQSCGGNRLNKATDIAPRRERITAAGAALEEAQLLMYPSGSSQERIERGSQSPCATSKPRGQRAAHAIRGPLRTRLVSGNTC